MTDILVDADRAAAIVRAQFPDLGSGRVRYLGEGCDSVAIEIDGRWVFKFPKRADVDAELLREMRVLPALARTVPLAIPDYRFRGAPSMDYPFHFGGYRRIAGTPAIAFSSGDAPLVSWARPIAAFLSWLHTQPIAGAEALGVERQTTAALVDELRADALGDLDALARVAPDSPIAEWRQHFQAAPGLAPGGAAPAALVHRDFAAEHVLVDPMTSEITGVIDWTEIAIADPIVDFAGVYHWGGADFAAAVLEHYRGSIDRAALPIARYLAACRGAADVAFGEATHRPDYILAGLRSLAANVVRTR